MTTLPRRAHALHRLPALAFAAMALCGSLPAHAQTTTTFPTGAGQDKHISRDSAAPRTVAVVHQGVYDYVRIERAEDGAAPNLHPVDVDVAELTQRLGAIRIGPRALLDADDLKELVPHLIAALNQATPQQDVSFAVAGKHSRFGLLASRDITTGRLFNTAAGLQLIVGLAHRNFEDELRARGTLIPFEPGRRAAPVDKAVALKIAAPVGSVPRADWVILRAPTPMATAPAVAAPAPVAAPAATPAAPVVTAPATAPAPAPVATVTPPPTPATPAPAAAPRPAPGASSADAQARYLEASERLKTIDRLFKSGLITQQEYDEKRKQILAEL